MTNPDTATSLMLQAIEQLAALSQQVGVLSGQCNIIITQQQHDDESRKAVYDRLRDIEMKVATLERIAPLVDVHEQSHQRQKGAALALKALWAALAGGGGALLVLVARKLGFVN